MARDKKTRIDTSTSTGESLAANPFAALPTPDGPREQRPAPPPEAPRKTKPGMRLEVRRETGGRGGKTVTTVTGVAPLGDRRKGELLLSLKTRCGTGGTDRGNVLEIQGDQRNAVINFLEEAGFRPVRAGG